MPPWFPCVFPAICARVWLAVGALPWEPHRYIAGNTPKTHRGTVGAVAGEKRACGSRRSTQEPARQGITAQKWVGHAGLLQASCVTYCGPTA